MRGIAVFFMTHHERVYLCVRCRAGAGIAAVYEHTLFGQGVQQRQQSLLARADLNAEMGVYW
jgi:hypothetical protein